MRGNGRKRVFRVVVLVAVFLLVPALSVVAVQGQNQGVYPLWYQTFWFGSPALNQSVVSKADEVWGDTVIGSGESWVNESVTIVLDGNLTIESGGSLTLINVTLMVNCSSDGEHRIEVQSGGALYIKDTDGDPATKGDASNITAYDTDYSFLFWVKSGATFQMNNSEMHYCGYDVFPWPSNFNNFGLWINANNTIIENNTFLNNYVGLALYYAHYNTIRNNSIMYSEWSGIEVYYSSNNNFTGNNVMNSQTVGSGFYLGDSSDNVLIGNTASNNNRYGFWLDSSFTLNNTLIGNTAIDNWHGFVLTSNANNNNLTGNVAINNTHHIFEDYGFWLDSSSNNNLTGNVAVNSEYGFYVNASSSDNDLFGNDAVNCSVAGYFLGAGCVGDDLSGSTVSNFLRILVVDRGGVPVGGVDVRVASDGVDVYASPAYGGDNDTTGTGGLTVWIAVPYQRYSGVTSSALVVEAWVMGYGHRVVDMSSSHTETFTESLGLLPVLFLVASQGSQGVRRCSFVRFWG